MTESGTTPERFIRIYRDDPQFSEYLTARFGSADEGRDLRVSWRELSVHPLLDG